MNQEPSFRVSQGYDVVPPRPGRAYPILCEEWEYMKSQIAQISDEAMTFHTIGWLLLGACVSTFIAIITGSITIPPGAAETKLIIAWAVVAVTLIGGLLALFFSKQQRAVTRLKATAVVKQMELIEKRYEQPPAPLA